MTLTQLDRAIRTLVLAVLLPAACYSAGPGADRVVVRNDADASIVVLAFDVETAARVDLAPELVVEQHPGRVVAPGGERTLGPEDIEGGLGRDDDLVLFLYEVKGTRAMFRGSLSVPWAALEQSGWRVRIGPGVLAG